MYKKYLKQSLFLFISFMAIIGGINFIVDPGEIYFKKIIADSKAKEFSDKLFLSEYGIIQSGWNERLVKTILAKSSGDFDCVIMGSSHIMQISGVTNTGNINGNCKNLLNLGVSGGSLEDLAIFSYLVLNNLKLPNKVYLSVDPWTLKFGQDARYGAYMSYLKIMNKQLGNVGVSKNSSYTSKIVKNLFNWEYFYYSILELKAFKMSSNLPLQKKILYPDGKFSFKDGYSTPITLSDGSHLYADWQTKKQKETLVKIGGGAYKISRKEFQPQALNYFIRLIELYRQNNVEVNLIITPYHPNVFKNGVTKPVRHFLTVEKVVKMISDKYNIKLYGSFFPENLGCKENEFLDEMHATSECLNRIDFSH